MAWITDSLSAAINAASRFNPFARQAETGIAGIFQHQLAIAAFMSSGLLRKVIRIPAADRTQKWRDWQADKDAIALIEKEEKRLGLQAKTKQAEVLRGIGGGAMILVTAGDHSQPLNPETIRQNGLIAINVVSRWEITASEFDRDLASPTFRQPRMFSVSSEGKQAKIHPSRVICFRGDPLPAGSAVSDEEAFWGDSRLLAVVREVQNSDCAQAWFVELVKKAKLLRIGIPDLLDLVSTADGKKQLNERIALISTGESTLNATVYRSGTGTDDPGEKIDDYQINWTGIPAFMDALDQRVAAVADIPFTRLMGRSPAGMNATGEHDTDNWNDAVSDGQENETRPCLEMLDPILLRSAGVAKPDEATWKWAPLWTPTEAEEAETFDKFMTAIEKVQSTGAVPDRPFAESFQNFLIEREYLPGLETALKKLPDDERYGLDPEPDDSDPSALTEGGDPALGPRGQDRTPRPRRVAANDAWFNDATPRPLYVQRKLLNAAAVIAWAKDNGFDTTLPASDMHVTVLYSRAAVDLMKMGRDWREDEKGQITVRPGGPRALERLGEDAVVLRFACPDLDWRHKDMVEAGGTHDWPEYMPHVTLSYGVPADIDVEAIKPYNGPLVFGPEIFEALDLDWKRKVSEE